MLPYFDTASLAAGGLGVTAAVWHARQHSARARRILGALSFREREMRFAAHALMAAARTSPQAVIDVIERTGKILAPEIDGMLFAVVHEGMLVVEHAQGMHAAHIIGTRIALDGDSPLALAFRRGHRVLTHEGTQAPLPGDHAYIAIPLVDVGRVVGVVSLSSHGDREISNADALVALVDLAVSAYQISVDLKANIQSANIDALTGLLTPRAFREQLFDQLAEARLQRLPASLLFIDTDNFKACNDTYGHAAGDVVLGIIAALLKQEAGPDAVVARNGGDEFCVFLHTGKATALRRAESIRHEIAGYHFEHHLGVVPEKPITLSIGIASFPEDTNDAANLLQRADAAMYHSKRHGRNLVSFIAGSETLMTLQQANSRAS